MTAIVALPFETRAASIAARSPAIPEPTIIMSYLSVSATATTRVGFKLPFATLHEYKGESRSLKRKTSSVGGAID